MGKQKSEGGERKKVCTIDVTFKMQEVTGKMFLRQTCASGQIEGTPFSFDTGIPTGQPIVTVGGRVFTVTVAEIVTKLFEATHH